MQVLDTSVQSGVAKYFVHYNGWNSRYDEWIHKDVIVNVLEDPCIEMPKLRSSTTPSAKIMVFLIIYTKLAINLTFNC